MDDRVTHASIVPHITRRQALCRMGSGFGLIGLANALDTSLVQAGVQNALAGPLDPAACRRLIRSTRNLS